MTVVDLLAHRMLNRNKEECLHTVNVTVVSSGWERVICEGCSHLSFRHLAELTGKVDRSRFVRDVDRLAAVS